MSSTTLENPTAERSSGSQPERKKRKSPLPWFLLAPTLIVLGVLTGYPLIRLIIMSFQEYERAQLMGVPAEWVGFQNYTDILTDPDFWTVLARSFVFMIFCVFFTMLLGILIALLMLRLNKGFKLLTSIGLLLAWAMPQLATMIVFGWIFDTEYGVVNHVLTSITGNDWMGHSWLINPLSFFFVAGIAIIWQAVPFIAFTMYAGLSQVPGEVLEAAQLDGTSPFQRFRLIMVPFVRSILTVLIILSIIWDLRVFTQIFALQGVGGISEQTNTIGTYIYQVGMAQGHYGPASAIAVILVIIMMAISYYYVRQTLKEEEL
ncbi:carbohydrate ABC transporter permease [Paraoerskovia marina]|uniref:carbohydrate ABC transporter permease n=1 Tax=Paraoerskovia marina TaxID=545619 RepID=UPI0004929367|nr:sugar ABC transporter permease [Paraoerskovia marina]